ncbi:MAG: hypothetical protein WCI51_08250 [Lentisphaerota bacterium]
MPEIKLKVFQTKAGKTVSFSKGDKNYTLNLKATATHAEIEEAVKKAIK